MKVISIKLNQSLRVSFLYLLLKLWNLTTDKPAPGTKTNIIKEKLLEFVKSTLGHLKNPFIYCSLYLHSDRRVYLCPQSKPKKDIAPESILGLSVWLKKLKDNKLDRTELLEIFGRIKTTDLVSKTFIENFDQMSDEFKLNPIISNIGEELHIPSSAENSGDEELSTHEIVLDLNESLSLMEITKNEPKKSESILRSSTLSKIIAPIINRFEHKKPIPEVKNNESLTGFFENLPEPTSQSVKNEQNSAEIFTFENALTNNSPRSKSFTESLAMNNLTIKTDAKNSLPEFSEEFDSAESWTQECIFIFSLLGYGTKDQRVMIGAMINKLNKELAAAVQQNLSQLDTEISNLTIDDFVKILSNLTKKTPYEIEKNLEDLKIDFTSQASYRSTYWRLRSLLARQLGFDAASTPLNKANINKIVAREFKKKLPASVTQNLTFRMSECEGIALADLAFNINQLSQVGLNNFKTFNVNRGNSRGRSSFRGRFNFNNRGNFQQNQPQNFSRQNSYFQRGNSNNNRGNYRGNFNNRDNFNNSRGQTNRFQRPQNNFQNYRDVKCNFCGN